MEDPFSTPLQRQTKPASMPDLVSVSKNTFVSLLHALPFQELHLQSQVISDDNDYSAILMFIQELGRALSNIQITPSTKRTSPKRILSATLDRPIPTERFSSPEEETPTKVRYSLHAPQAVPAPEPEPEPRGRHFSLDEDYAKWKRRQDILNHFGTGDSFHGNPFQSCTYTDSNR